MDPDDLLCSRNARPQKALVGRAQYEGMFDQPAVYKLDSELPDTTHAELTQGKTDESEEPSS
jgi:hypothetical protein